MVSLLRLAMLVVNYIIVNRKKCLYSVFTNLIHGNTLLEIENEKDPFSVGLNRYVCKCFCF